MALKLELSFRLKLPGSDQLDGLQAVSTSFRVRGLLCLTEEMLTIQWGGVVRVQDVSPLSVRDESEVLPDERVIVPVRHLHSAILLGGWWRPRLTLHAKAPGALAEVPSEVQGTVQFWCARRDRAVALALATALNDAISAGRPVR